MQLHCLGTAGYHPNEQRQTSCYMLPEAGIVLDAGTGFFRVGERLQTQTLDILLSHAHLDHVVGLTFLLDTLHQHPLKSVRVWGEAEKLDVIRTHLANSLLFPVELPVQWCPIDDLTQLNLETATAKWRPQEHPGGSVAYRIEIPVAAEKTPASGDLPAGSCDEWITLIYATDTTGATSAADLDWMRDADLLLHECNFSDEQQEWAEKTGHCWPERIAAVCRVAQPKQLLLTHINPMEDLEIAADDPRFAMPLAVAADGAVWEIGSVRGGIKPS